MEAAKAAEVRAAALTEEEVGVLARGGAGGGCCGAGGAQTCSRLVGLKLTSKKGFK